MTLFRMKRGKFFSFKVYKVKETIVYQYKNSSVLLENNGNKYSSKSKSHQHQVFLLPTVSSKVNLKWSTVPLKTWSWIISASLCKAHCSSISKILSQASGTKYTSPPQECVGIQGLFDQLLFDQIIVQAVPKQYFFPFYVSI